MRASTENRCQPEEQQEGLTADLDADETQCMPASFVSRASTVVALTGALALGIFASPAAAAPAPTITWVDGDGVVAFVWTEAPVDCVVTGAVLSAGNTTSKLHHGTHDSASELILQLYQVDVCKDETLLWVDDVVPLDDKDLVVTGHLGSATLRTVVRTTDQVTNSPVELSLDLVWTTTGGLNSFRNSLHEFSRGVTAISHGSDASRTAEVHGSVRRGATDLAQGTTSNGFIVAAGTRTLVIDRQATPGVLPMSALDSTRTDADSAAASFDSSDPSGCVVTSVTVQAIEERDGSATGSRAGVSILRLDVCAPEILLVASGERTLGEDGRQFDFAAGLGGATLATNIDVTDAFTGARFPVSVDVTWIGVGLRRLSVSTFQGRTEDESVSKLNTHLAVRDAHAAATVTLPDEPSNLAPGPASFAQVSSARSHWRISTPE